MHVLILMFAQIANFCFSSISTIIFEETNPSWWNCSFGSDPKSHKKQSNFPFFFKLGNTDFLVPASSAISAAASKSASNISTNLVLPTWFMYCGGENMVFLELKPDFFVPQNQRDRRCSGPMSADNWRWPYRFPVPHRSCGCLAARAGTSEFMYLVLPMPQTVNSHSIVWRCPHWTINHPWYPYCRPNFPWLHWVSELSRWCLAWAGIEPTISSSLKEHLLASILRF